MGIIRKILAEELLNGQLMYVHVDSKLITKTFLRHYNVRQRLLNSPIPEGFSYQPVFLEHPSAKSLHLPIITEEGVASNLLTQKKPTTSLSNSGSMLEGINK